MIKAIIWDYDGTLVDTRRKNLAVTREIMQEILEDSIDNYPVLKSIEQYQAANEKAANWRELYQSHFQLSDSKIDEAGAMWKNCQMNNDTEVTLFENMSTILRELNNYRHGIVSQNARENIIAFLTENKLRSIFSKIVGYEDIEYNRQKPDPAGLLNCIEYLTDTDEGSIVYIGDHETDMHCTYLADQKLKEDGQSLQVYSIAACYSFAKETQDWEYTPNFKAYSPEDIHSIITDLDN